LFYYYLFSSIELVFIKFEQLHNCMKVFHPNLFIPGAGKSGTSSLHQLLGLHPEICMSKTKEPHFWTRLDYNKFTNEERQQYASLFDEKSDAKYYGESSTGYMVFPNFIKRIKANYDFEPKFIFILRNPIDRCYSHYWWLKGIGSEKNDLRTAFLNDKETEPRPEIQLPETNYKCYYQYGLYAKWLEKFYVNFDSKNIKVICYESLKTKPLNTINDCFNFLNLKPLDKVPEIHSNKTLILKAPYLYRFTKLLTYNKLGIPQFIKDSTPNKIKELIRKKLAKTVLEYTKTDKTYPKIKTDDRLFLKQYYEADVLKLRRLTGLNFSEWTDFNN
jgi:Sulfotransferase domain